MTTTAPSRAAEGRELKPAPANEKAPFLRIGHRGAPSHFPENTIRSFEKAVEIGVDMVEFDVRITKDRHLVVTHANKMHDARSRKQRLHRATLGEIREWRIGHGERVPLFEEVVELLGGRVLMNIDLKDKGEEEQVVKTIARHGVEKDVLISSHYACSLRRIKELDPSLRVGISVPGDFLRLSMLQGIRPLRAAGLALLRRSTRAILERRIERARADAVMLYYRLVSPALVEWIRERGCEVYVWTIDDHLHIRRCLAMGVDGIASNHPDLLFGDNIG
jgi:glycerophosphoryl diester phosphodiesterase